MAPSPFISSLSFQRRAQPAEHFIQPHAAYLYASMLWKTDPAYSRYTSHPPPTAPSFSASSQSAASAGTTRAAMRGNLHFNRQSCSPSPNEGYVLRQTAGNVPSCTSFEWTLQMVTIERKVIFLATGSFLSASYGNVFINIYTFTTNRSAVKWDLMWSHFISGVIKGECEALVNL